MMTENENFRTSHDSTENGTVVTARSNVTCVIVKDGRGHKRWECQGCASHGVWSTHSDHEGNAVTHLRKAHLCPGTIEICGDMFFDRICTLPKHHQRDGEKWGFGHWGPDIRVLRELIRV